MLDRLKASEGAKKKPKRVGRGPGSGNGGTAGRGHKGQRSRSGARIGVGFEGGQMPLQRRMPKRGFFNFTRRPFQVVNLADLARFDEGSVVDPAALKAAGLIHRIDERVKILGRGECGKPLTVKAQGFSKKAREKIESSGGTAEVIGLIRKQPKQVEKSEEEA
ncbi:MAG: 50S ribosomal protein L15 [Deltaproteobacteria bacterium]|nr:50S ribosomal protein L15 [Deltaproteobacteria bacterium]